MATKNHALIAAFIPHLAPETGHFICQLSGLPGDPEPLVRQSLSLLRHRLSPNESEPLHTAIKKGNHNVTQCLIDFGVSANCLGPQFNTTVMLAVENDDHEMIALLLRNGASIHKNGKSALLNAVRNGASERTLHTLVRHGFAGLDDAIDLCVTDNLPLQLNVLEHAPPNGPGWHRQAKERGISEIRIQFDRGSGLIFYPLDLDKPLGVGGDYDGNWPISAVDYLKERVEPGDEKIRWFFSYIKKIAGLEDFTLDEILKQDIQEVICSQSA